MSPENSFVLPGARRHDGRDRTIDVVHIDLWLQPDLLAQSLAGICTIEVAPIDAPVSSIALDAVDLNIASITARDRALAFVACNGTLTIDLPKPLVRGDTLTLAIAYRVERPQRGLYFPPAGTDEADRQCWTHGHAGGAKYWFPCVDQPQQRQTSTTTIVIAAGLFALANGNLTDRAQNTLAGTTTFRYEHRRPHASSLFTMVVGRFAEIELAAGPVPVFAFASPRREADALRTFGNAPAMLAAFERFTGAPYPYGRYSQIAVSAFPFIGMENTTASTFTEQWLLDARTLASPAVESLVAHELAHQWFGNLVASREWSDVWLNEGFASYCEAVWDEAAYGWDAYAYAVFRQWRTYVGEAAQRYTRAIVCSHFRAPIDLFDKHLYEKAGTILHMLRGALGEARFARAIARYVHDNYGAEVQTIDFIRAIEASTGRNMREFFAQWLERAGHPVISVRFEYDSARGIARLHFSQQQRIDAMQPAYRFTIRVGLLQQLPQRLASNFGPAALDGEERIDIDVDAAETVCTIALERFPALVRIDPGAWTAGEFTLDLGTELSCAAVTFDPDPIARIRAAAALVRDDSPQARNALAAALTSDPFWGARAEYATLLGSSRAEWARAMLLGALADHDARVRRAVCAALGYYRGLDIAAALESLVSSEPADEVIGEALQTLGKAHDPRVALLLRSALAGSSWCDCVGAGALLGLAELDHDSTADAIMQAAQADRADRRESAIRALAVLGARQPLVRASCVRRCVELLADPDAMVRLRAIAALDELGDYTTAVALESLSRSEPIPWVASHALRAAVRLRSGVPTPALLADLNSEMQTLRTANEQLNGRVDALER